VAPDGRLLHNQDAVASTFTGESGAGRKLGGGGKVDGGDTIGGANPGVGNDGFGHRSPDRHGHVQLREGKREEWG